MSERPRCCRNLTSAFNATVDVEADLQQEPPELGENRENLFVEELINNDREGFKARWGYDVVEDKPVEGSNWEYELIYPQPPPQEVAVVEGVDDVISGEDEGVEGESEQDGGESEEGVESA